MKQNASGFIITKDTRTCRHAAAERSANTQSEISLCVLVFLVLAQRCHSGFKKKTKNTNCKLKLTKPSTAAAVIFSYINRAGGKLNFPHSCSYFPKMMTKIRSWPKIWGPHMCWFIRGGSVLFAQRALRKWYLSEHCGRKWQLVYEGNMILLCFYLTLWILFTHRRLRWSGPSIGRRISPINLIAPIKLQRIAPWVDSVVNLFLSSERRFWRTL